MKLYFIELMFRMEYTNLMRAKVAGLVIFICIISYNTMRVKDNIAEMPIFTDGIRIGN